MQNVKLCIKGSEKKYIGNCEMAMLLMSQGDVFKNGESETFRCIEIEGRINPHSPASKVYCNPYAPTSLDSSTSWLTSKGLFHHILTFEEEPQHFPSPFCSLSL
jgi:hypothetical protein